MLRLTLEVGRENGFEICRLDRAIRLGSKKLLFQRMSSLPEVEQEELH